MEKDIFLQQIRDQFEETDSALITFDTFFKQLEEWSSMHALLLIALIDAEYNVPVTGEDLQKCLTVEDLYNTVKSRVG
ncbi:acyl carrier protein [Sphingobacteriales bacterium UPWRP_1]|nr:acyl carrier protein [Sphingobacteriales bacterium TSM_CSS]PSJ75510.1 acyl carrier protein [Sphingobacteriales bacterium UPWRP_1]